MRSGDVASTNQLGGTVHGPAVQAGNIGAVHMHVPAVDAVMVPWQLPPVSRVFTDRERDRERLSLLLSEVGGEGIDPLPAAGPVVVALYGPAGIGKTALAGRWLHEQRDRFPDGLLHARFDASGPAQRRDPDSVLAGFLLALGVARRALPAEPEHRTALYRTLTASRALAVLLDDVGEVEHVTSLMPSGSGCVLVVTSRRPLSGLIEHGARLHPVTSLAQDHGLSLFRNIAGSDRVHADLQAAAELVGRCGGRPLTIAVLAANAAQHPSVPLAELAAELGDLPLDTLDREDNVVDRAVTADYEGLDPLGQVLFRLIGVQPVSSLSFPMLLTLSPERPPVETAQVADEQPLDPAGRSRSRRAARVRRVLDDLVTAHLLTHHPAKGPSTTVGVADPWEMDGPVWEIDAVPHHVARHLAEVTDPEDVRRAALIRVVDLVLWPALHAADMVVTPYRRRTPYPGSTGSMPGESVLFADRAGALAWLERYVDIIAAYVRALFAAGEYRRAWHLVDALWALWLHRKHYALRLELDALALRAARAWGDESAQAEMFKRIGLAQTSLRAFDEAAEALKAALALRLKLRDRWGEADCRNALGLYHQAVGNIDQAGDQFRLAARLYQASGALREQALVNHNLGALHLDAGNYNHAQVQLARTLEEFAALPQPDEYNASRTRIALARVHVAQGQYHPARALAVDAVAGMARLANAVEHARALEVLADIAQATDDPSYPHRLADALALYESVHSPHADRVRARLAATATANATANATDAAAAAATDAEFGQDRVAGNPESERP